MSDQKRSASEVLFLPTEQLEQLYQQLKLSGYSIVAPQQIDGAIVYSESESIDTLPQGLVDQQSPGHYQLKAINQERYFSWSSGAQGVKSVLFPPEQQLWQSNRQESGELRFTPNFPEQQPVALFGVRACDLSSIALMDRHFLRDGEEDPWYQQRRSDLLLITISCSHASESCFCASTETGPEAKQGYDLRLDELDSGFLLRAGSERGEKVQRLLNLDAATLTQLHQAEEQLSSVLAQQQRTIASDDFRPHFATQQESSIWNQIAERCLGCGNCTAVCPTCFCHREEEVSSLDLESSTHQRVWDSCFSDEHSQLHGIPVRTGRPERYRQWMTHKLGGWHDQFGESGCVGCGRCITWCPVGIDLVEESARFIEGNDHE